jgi:hypothetical protein
MSRNRETFIFAKVSSVKTSNLDVIPGAIPSNPGLTCVEYRLYIDGASAISAIARLRHGQYIQPLMKTEGSLHPNTHSRSTRKWPPPLFHFSKRFVPIVP